MHGVILMLHPVSSVHMQNVYIKYNVWETKKVDQKALYV